MAAVFLSCHISSVAWELFLQPIPQFCKLPNTCKQIPLLLKPASVNSIICQSRFLTITVNATSPALQKVVSHWTFLSTVFLKLQLFMYHLPPNLPYNHTIHIIYQILFLQWIHFFKQYLLMPFVVFFFLTNTH